MTEMSDSERREFIRAALCERWPSLKDLLEPRRLRKALGAAQTFSKPKRKR